MNRLALALAVAGLSGASFGQQTDKPAPSATTPSTAQPGTHDKAAPKPKIYDEAADAKQQINAALAKAKRENQRVLIQWGGNWCPWCHLLHEKLASDKDLKHELLYEYQLVLVDAGGKDKKNMDLAASYGADIVKEGYPYLTVLDASGKVLANQETSSLESKGADGKSLGGAEAGHDAPKVLAFLKGVEAGKLQADAVLKDGIDQARSSGRMVFLHFGAPWCGWCHKLEDWLAQDEIAKTFAKDYIDLKIDQDRMIGAAEVEAKQGMPKNSGIPWFVIIDPATGKALADSTGPKGNIGYPAQDDEIEHFMTMLDKTHKNLAASDLERLKESLVSAAKKIKASH